MRNLINAVFAVSLVALSGGAWASNDITISATNLYVDEKNNLVIQSTINALLPKAVGDNCSVEVLFQAQGADGREVPVVGSTGWAAGRCASGSRGIAPTRMRLVFPRSKVRGDQIFLSALAREYRSRVDRSSSVLYPVYRRQTINGNLIEMERADRPKYDLAAFNKAEIEPEAHKPNTSHVGKLVWADASVEVSGGPSEPPPPSTAPTPAPQTPIVERVPKWSIDASDCAEIDLFGGPQRMRCSVAASVDWLPLSAGGFASRQVSVSGDAQNGGSLLLTFEAGIEKTISIVRSKTEGSGSISVGAASVDFSWSPESLVDASFEFVASDGVLRHDLVLVVGGGRDLTAGSRLSVVGSVPVGGSSHLFSFVVVGGGSDYRTVVINGDALPTGNASVTLTYLGHTETRSLSWGKPSAKSKAKADEGGGNEVSAASAPTLSAVRIPVGGSVDVVYDTNTYVSTMSWSLIEVLAADGTKLTNTDISLGPYDRVLKGGAVVGVKFSLVASDEAEAFDNQRIAVLRRTDWKVLKVPFTVFDPPAAVEGEIIVSPERPRADGFAYVEVKLSKMPKQTVTINLQGAGVTASETAIVFNQATYDVPRAVRVEPSTTPQAGGVSGASTAPNADPTLTLSLASGTEGYIAPTKTITISVVSEGSGELPRCSEVSEDVECIYALHTASSINHASIKSLIKEGRVFTNHGDLARVIGTPRYQSKIVFRCDGEDGCSHAEPAFDGMPDNFYKFGVRCPGVNLIEIKAGETIPKGKELSAIVRNRPAHYDARPVSCYGLSNAPFTLTTLTVRVPEDKTDEEASGFRDPASERIDEGEGGVGGTIN